MSKAIGISKVEYGTVGDGVPAIAFTEIAEAFVEESVVFGFGEPSDTKIPQETKDTAYHTITTKEDPDYIEFKLLTPAAATLVTLMGGSATGEKWEEPPAIPEINLTIKITTKTVGGYYYEYTIVNGKVVGRLDGAPSKKKAETVNIRVYKEAAITAAGAENTPFTRERVAA